MFTFIIKWFKSLFAKLFKEPERVPVGYTTITATKPTDTPVVIDYRLEAETRWSESAKARAQAKRERKVFRGWVRDAKPREVSADERKANRDRTAHILAKRQARNAELNARHLAAHPLSKRGAA